MKQTLYILIIFLGLYSHQMHGQVVINELLSSGNFTTQDAEGDFPDWVELWNQGSSKVNLSNWKLTDDQTLINKWTFPSVNIEPNSYLLVFLSGKNQFFGSELHTSFSLSSGGEVLKLYDESSNLIDATPAIPIPGRHSYGRSSDSSNLFYFFSVPTPNQQNGNEHRIILGQPELLQISHQSGFYNNSIDFEITSSDPQSKLRYESDGREPNANSPVLTSSILVTDASSNPNSISLFRTSSKAYNPPKEKIQKASIYRFASFKNGIRTSDIHTRSFFIDPNGRKAYGLPVVSIQTNPENLFNSSKGIYVPGEFYEQGNNWSGNYYQRGRLWEYPMNIEYFTRDNNLVINQICGARINGFSSRSMPQKSLRLYARSEYQNKNFNYRLFKQKQHSSYKRLIFRAFDPNGMGNGIANEVAQDIAAGLGIDYRANQAVIVFINGEYWGIHKMQERLDTRYFAMNHGVDEEEVDLLIDHSSDDTKLLNELNEAIDYVLAQDPADPNVLNKINNVMDESNLIGYVAMQMYASIWDWPELNVITWRSNEMDGKWRWVFTDGDLSLTNYHEDNLSKILGSRSRNPTVQLFFGLLKIPAFKQKLSVFIQNELGSAFSAENVLSHIENHRKELLPEIQEHALRWGYPENIQAWERSIAVLKNFAVAKPTEIYSRSLDISENAVQLFPTITQGSISLSTQLIPEGTSNFFVYNENGTLVLNGKIQEGNWDNDFTINVERLNVGKYIIEVYVNGVAYQKIFFKF